MPLQTIEKNGRARGTLSQTISADHSEWVTGTKGDEKHRGSLGQTIHARQVRYEISVLTHKCYVSPCEVEFE